MCHLLLGVVSEAGDDVGVVVGVVHQPESRSLSTSGRRASLGADQAERLASSTEADWGGRSHGGPDHGVVLPAAGGGWALSGAQGGANTTFALLKELSPIRGAGQLIGLGFWLEIISNTQAGPTPQWAPSPARALTGGLLPLAARSLGWPGCPLAKLELGNTTGAGAGSH